ncbi:hypothetical protein ACL02S_22135 [Nocardia sp. 004]|uniref:hypothetical protein n=1 Tax=Nocardia sp. 004 TaxID=3385978 RepID=UPI00399F6DDA
MSSRGPQPPFTAELLADLHAGNMTSAQREELWPAVSRDPEALSFLRSLDDVSAELRALGRDERIIHAMPEDVTARLTRFIDELDMSGDRSTPTTTDDGHLPQAPATGSSNEPPAPESIPRPVSLDGRRRSTLRWFAAAAATIVLIAGGGGVISTLRDSDRAHPTAAPPTRTDQFDDALPPTAALSALGRHDATGVLAWPEALERCVQANGLDRDILGSTDITFQGDRAVLILLTGPRPPKITALVVGTGCSADDPQRKALQDIG